MSIGVPDHLLQILTISMVFSMVLMSLIQKLKACSVVKKCWHIWLLNLACALVLGVPFGIAFYNLNWLDSIWVSIFSFIGAPSLYDSLKNFKPASLSEVKNSKTNTTQDS